MAIELDRIPSSHRSDKILPSTGHIDAEHLANLVDRLTAGRPTAVPPGLVVWITGLSGAGKTTVAGLLAPRFQDAARPCVILDGDAVRALLHSELGLEFGHDRGQRLHLARLYGRLCHAIAERGCDVLCATVSMFHEVREWNRRHIPNYLEVYLRVPLDEIRRRDPKGLYARADTGGGGNMVGMGIPAEEPRTPDLVIDHHPDRTPDDTAEDIWRKVCERNASLSTR